MKKVIAQPTLFDDIKDKFQDSTSSIEELRLAMFAPIKKFAPNSNTMKRFKTEKKLTRKTNWGTLTIEKTPLSQNHKDLLDCVLTYGESVKPLDNPNTIGYAFSASEMLKKYYGEDTKTKNTKTIEKMLTDMMSAVISIKPTNGDFHKFQILSYAGYRKELDSFYIEFNQKYVKFFTESLTINYSESLPEILKIDSLIVKAIIRLSLTHEKASTMKIYDEDKPEGKTGILEAIGFPIESVSQKKRAFKELKDNVENLKKFGIYYDIGSKNNIKYVKNKDRKISFIPPATKKALISKGNNEEECFLKLQDFVGKKFIKEKETYKIDSIYMNIEKDKIVISCYQEKDEDKNLKLIEVANLPTQAYSWLEEIVED